MWSLGLSSTELIFIVIKRLVGKEADYLMTFVQLWLIATRLELLIILHEKVNSPQSLLILQPFPKLQELENNFWMRRFMLVILETTPHPPRLLTHVHKWQSPIYAAPPLQEKQGPYFLRLQAGFRSLCPLIYQTTAVLRLRNDQSPLPSVSLAQSLLCVPLFHFPSCKLLLSQFLLLQLHYPHYTQTHTLIAFPPVYTSCIGSSVLPSCLCVDRSAVCVYM